MSRREARRCGSAEDERAEEFVRVWHRAGLTPDLDRGGYGDELVRAIVAWVNCGDGHPHALLGRALREQGSGGRGSRRPSGRR